MTNGDVIRQMSNEELAKVFANDECPPFGGNSYKCKHFTCKECWCEWLNAPAESEVKKMNETCADCTHFNRGNRCMHREVITWRKSPACQEFTGKYKGTLFDRITASPEVLAEKLVYCVPVPLFDHGAGLERWYTVFSPFNDTKYFRTKDEAIVATVEKLKEVAR